jgi:transcription initiation factor TFIID subunit 7
MLQVTHPISSEASVLEGGGGGNHSRLNVEEYIYPHGITPPLKHVRKRRYRKRVSRRVRSSCSGRRGLPLVLPTDRHISSAPQTIEIVEEEVERLLDEDSKADQSTYGALA